MKLRELEAFDAFMRHGGTQKAADAMGVGQPLVSRLLSALERQAGFALFQRKRNRLVPTAEAVLFHDSVAATLDQLRGLEQEARDIANLQRGNIVVAAQPIFCDTFLLDAVATFKRAHPQVGIRIIDVGREDLLAMMAEHRCHLGLGITLDTVGSGADVTPLAHCEARCIMRADHPLNTPGPIPLPRLRNEPFVELAPGSPLRTRVDSLMQSIGIQRTIAAEMRHLRGVCGLVARGTGIALIDPIAELLLDGTDVVSKPLIPSIGWEIALFTSRNRAPAAVVAAFADTLRAEIETLQARGLVS
ncbi:LysR family transcriptional regulator [Pontibaca salina]|uniref:LysR family transcriptional regulator n=1 Tax=Pontibaca salina TaxID=2795731 RepID=A0A934M335_9RHOB|nr:LysR family transcriptional regulator [Pontibaca salina]MBI6629444.1 LysR family transcriptional regulator [Pontibaca salina]